MTFFAEAEAEAGADLPQFVKNEFDAFLECGILDDHRVKCRTPPRHDQEKGIWVSSMPGWQFPEIAIGHCPMVSAPQALVRALLTVASAP